MRTFAIVVVTAFVALALIAAGLWAGLAWAQGRWDAETSGYTPMGRFMMAHGLDVGTIESSQDMPCDQDWQASNMHGYGMMGIGMMGGGQHWDEMPCDQDWQASNMHGYGMMGTGMMGGGPQWDEMPCGDANVTPDQGEVGSLEDAETAVHSYVERLGYTGLGVTEVMEFERNYYAIVAEEGTGIGAMELLVDKESGAVSPEPGPNMMWNAKYGMMGSSGMGSGMRGMMGDDASGEMILSPQEAQDVAQQWLDANLPGRTAGDADEFYGYYTLHFLHDGQIEGMLSVHGASGDVWYHGWHGDFVDMTGEHG